MKPRSSLGIDYTLALLAFPPGTKIEWDDGPVRRKGVVISFSGNFNGRCFSAFVQHGPLGSRQFVPINKLRVLEYE